MTVAAAGHELSYAAFYADCEHEVRPVRSGYRLCLTYNMTLARSRGKRPRLPDIQAPSEEPGSGHGPREEGWVLVVASIVLNSRGRKSIALVVLTICSL